MASAMVETAGDQDGGVDGAEHDVHVGAAFVERLRVIHPVNGKGREQSAEEHHLGRQEDPHPDGRGFALLLRRAELLAQHQLRSD